MPGGGAGYASLRQNRQREQPPSQPAVHHPRIVDLAAVPEDKREQEFGDDNPVPLVEFLNIDDEVAASHDPIVRESPKTGRNDPCPCGSGKKFKKCCGA